MTHIPLLGVLCCLSLTLAVPWNETVVTTYGAVQGFVFGQVIHFSSIPYAAPPVGNLRFAPPTPPTPWQGVKSVSAPPAICPQFKIFNADLFGSEDCLYIHVYVPQHDPGVSLPVMFWIYGGGYSEGDADEFGWYDGTNLAINKNVIVVAPNYRLDQFGFLALDELRAEAEGTTGNYALQDQTFALQWTQANIAAFGGDPTKVTIFGESAGGFSICWHLVSPVSTGLFSHAIMESGSCDSPQFFQNFDYAQSFSREYAAACGCPQTGDALLTCLRGLSTLSLMGCTIPTGPAYASPQAQSLKNLLVGGIIPALWPFMPWGPAIDGTRVGLLDDPLKLIVSGKYNKVPCIFGTNANEGSIFIPALALMVPGVHFPPGDADLVLVIERMFDMFNSTTVQSLIPQILRMYPAADYKGNGWTPVWVYHFEYQMHFLEYPLLGDYHTSELVFVFDNEFPPILHNFDANDRTISAAFQQYWTNLGSLNDPNSPDAPLPWPPYSPTTDTLLQFALPFSTISGLYKPFCDFWDNVAMVLNS